MSDTVSLFAFYFTLIGFISGIFFTRLDKWHSDVRAAQAVLTKATTRDEYKHSDKDFAKLESSRPVVSFILVGMFISVLAWLGFQIPLQTETTIDLWMFLKAPVLATVLLYWVGGGALLLLGTLIINKGKAEANKKAKG